MTRNLAGGKCNLNATP